MNKRWITAAAALAFSAAACAQDAGEMTKEAIAETLNNVDPADITESPIDGFYEVTVGSQVAYVSKNGRYLMQGELYDLATSRNLTEDTRAGRRVDALKQADTDSMIVFSPKDGNVRHSITIFTDIDCGYCRQFHREIADVNELGIEVRYLSYPRTGPDTESWTKAVKVWCSDDRAASLTQAKLGGRVPEESCDAAPIQSHWDLGHEVGVRGTPAVYSSEGMHLGGYLPPDQLLELLEDLEAE